jgi:HD superfamily phosphodiesterase
MELIEDIQEFIKEKHSQSERHDYSHVLQVVRYAIQIAKAIPDEVNPFVLICGALFHDVGWIGTDTGVLHGLRGATIVDEYFNSTWVSADVKKKIKRIVIRHTATSMMLPQKAEEKIVWDADGLDGMGLIGILRGLPTTGCISKRAVASGRSCTRKRWKSSKVSGEPWIIV